MRNTYFKARKAFSFSHHPFDIGTALGLWQNHDDNHFLLKIYSLEEEKFDEYYNYHLYHTLENNIGEDEDFYSHVWQIVKNRIKHFEQQDPFSRNHAMHINNLHKLQLFQKFLNSIDKWNARPPQLIITERDELINTQRIEIDELKEKLKYLNQYEVVQKIRIEEDHLGTLVDLVKQMRELKLPSGRLLLRCDNKSPFSKLISKYFSIGGNDIPTETTRNYFVEKKGDVAAKERPLCSSFASSYRRAG